MRKAQEDLLLAGHADGKIRAIVLGLPDFYGPGVDKSFLHSAFKVAVKGGVANMVNPLDEPPVRTDRLTAGCLAAASAKYFRPLPVLVDSARRKLLSRWQSVRRCGNTGSCRDRQGPSTPSPRSGRSTRVPNVQIAPGI